MSINELNKAASELEAFARNAREQDRIHHAAEYEREARSLRSEAHAKLLTLLETSK